MWPHRWQPTRLPRPWDSPSKNTGVGCHFLLQCMKVKSESEVAQSCLTPSDPMDCSLPGSLHPWDFPGKSTGVGCHCLLRLTCYLDLKRTPTSIDRNTLAETNWESPQSIYLVKAFSETYLGFPAAELRSRSISYSNWRPASVSWVIKPERADHSSKM